MLLVVDPAVTIMSVEVLLQIILFGDVITGVGSTVTTTLIGGPVHKKVVGVVPIHGVML